MHRFYYFSFLFFITIAGCSQNLDFGFIKNCLSLNETEFVNELSKMSFRLLEKEHKNMGDKLINKTEYYSNKTSENQLENTAETALFVNLKRGKKSIFITFSQSISFSNFNSIESEIKKNFKKESVFQSEKYESSILKFSNESSYYYLFKEEDTYYLIISNYLLEEVYFGVK